VTKIFPETTPKTRHSNHQSSQDVVEEEDGDYSDGTLRHLHAAVWRSVHHVTFDAVQPTLLALFSLKSYGRDTMFTRRCEKLRDLTTADLLVSPELQLDVAEDVHSQRPFRTPRRDNFRLDSVDLPVAPPRVALTPLSPMPVPVPHLHGAGRRGDKQRSGTGGTTRREPPPVVLPPSSTFAEMAARSPSLSAIRSPSPHTLPLGGTLSIGTLPLGASRPSPLLPSQPIVMKSNRVATPRQSGLSFTGNRVGAAANLPPMLLPDPALDTSGSVSCSRDASDDADAVRSDGYEEAVSILRAITRCRAPLQKIDAIVEMSRALCRCVDRHYGNSKEGLMIGGDDLLALFAFCVVRAQVPSLLAELELVDAHMGKRLKLSAAGYYVSTLKAAVALVQNIASLNLPNQSVLISATSSRRSSFNS
ncbi:MAG: hypothetical protein MHM6MM_006791, partial [Cercozoa sp. M6MM]